MNDLLPLLNTFNKYINKYDSKIHYYDYHLYIYNNVLLIMRAYSLSSTTHFYYFTTRIIFKYLNVTPSRDDLGPCVTSQRILPFKHSKSILFKMLHLFMRDVHSFPNTSNISMAKCLSITKEKQANIIPFF